MPTSSSGPLTMLARSMGQRPPPAPGKVSYSRPKPPRYQTKEPWSKSCSSESRCPVDNVLRIGPCYATWEDPRPTDNPRTIQNLAYGLLHGEIDHPMHADGPMCYRLGDDQRCSTPCPAPGHRQRAWQAMSPATGGPRQLWMSSVGDGLTRTRSAPWLPQQIWHPHRNHVPPVNEYGMTSSTSMTQLPFELVARKAKIFRRPRSAQPKPSNSSMYHDTYKRPSSALPTVALPTARLAPRELSCTACVDRYCGSNEPDQAYPSRGFGIAPQRNYSPRPYRETLSYEDSYPEPCCAGYGNNTYVDSSPPSYSTEFSKKAQCGQAKRIAGYNNTPCDVTDPDAFSVIESYCDGDWKWRFCL